MTPNPPWVEDELLLVLDLYLQERRVLEEYDPRVVSVSELLNRLPIYTEAGEPGFRTPDAVVLKLANFRSYDPLTDARGMSNAGRRAEEVWRRYADAPEQVGHLAEAVRAAAESAEGKATLFPRGSRMSTLFPRDACSTGAIGAESATPASEPGS